MEKCIRSWMSTVAIFSLLMSLAGCAEDDNCGSGGSATSVDGISYCVYSTAGTNGASPCGPDEESVDLTGGGIAAVACVKSDQAPAPDSDSLERRFPINELSEFAVELGFIVQDEPLVCRDSYDSAEYLLREAAMGCSTNDDCALYVGYEVSDQLQCLYYLGRGYGVLATTDVTTLTDALEAVQTNYQAGGCTVCAGLFSSTPEADYAVACESGMCVARFIPDNSSGFR